MMMWNRCNSNIPYDMEVDEPLKIGKEANRELWNKYITRTTDSNNDCSDGTDGAATRDITLVDGLMVFNRVLYRI
ncbi:hypothetical protein DLAC_11774 [Tieghemostelium lacteum]|uniref:Uncharacterized protein n=1 Tax=Tieghemostelium lacteum TaxID=361077 RepID=A0A151Z6E0_TIELA|nr:hypothetical protein DLAC_11774 [Tieghemostelium lacteum]|eukprot:KYQ89523.1 hypothetical protein DLAC_11774 [Tieghemostelium lacteum]